jgi:tripartite-type tricarboxylate transporter receptor subunit TctC
MRRREFLALGAGALAAPAVLTKAHAGESNWPAKPVQITVPFPPGSASDILSRALGAPMGDMLGQPIVVENKPGAGGAIGTGSVAAAPADGYTLLMATAAHTITAVTMKKLTFDPRKDFIPVIELTTMPLVLVVHPDVKANSVQELVALAKDKPGGISFASSGPGTTHQMASELLKLTAGIDIVHVPYRGSGPAQLDLTTGRVDMMFDNIVACIANVRAGKLRPLAVSSKQRSSILPNVPTMAESGYPDFDVGAWFGIMVRAGTPQPIVDRIATVSGDAMRQPKVSDLFTKDGAVVTTKTGAAFEKLLEADYSRWETVAKESRIQIE